MHVHQKFALISASSPSALTPLHNIALEAESPILGRMIRAVEKPSVDQELKRRIQELIDYKGGGFNQEHVADIIENALKLLSDVKDTGDVKVIQTALREMR